jgi:hypothetical protein
MKGVKSSGQASSTGKAIACTASPSKQRHQWCRGSTNIRDWSNGSFDWSKHGFQRVAMSLSIPGETCTSPTTKQ